MNVRIEKDALGELEIPAEAYYGIHTARSLENFKVAGTPFPLEIVCAIVQLKRACARANEELGNLDRKKADAIVTACERILAGEFNDHFLIDIFQAGSGTSSNMNINEVIANIACEQMGFNKGEYKRVHPNDDVNMGQSTNNIVPSGIRLAGHHYGDNLLAGAEELLLALSAKTEEFADILKSGRTHLQDAVPVTLGQEFGAYARAVGKACARIKAAQSTLLELGVGGNAVGTGINTKAEFRKLVVEHLNKTVAEEFYPAENGIEATQFLTDIAQFSSAVRLFAGDLLKISNDLRLLSSGPNTGLAEINLPAVEPGSSIMPGKINPSICEAANMACMQVMGNDHAIGIATAAGQLELNTHMPLVGAKLIDSLVVMTRCCRMLAEKCIRGISANSEVCEKNFFASAGLATVLNPALGYDRVSELVKESLATKTSIRDLILAKGLMEESELDQLLANSTGPVKGLAK